MKNEIEMIADEYIVQSSIEIGDYRYIFARHKDENEKHPYMKCREKADGFLCYYDKSIVSDDYIELMRLYIQDLSEAVEQLDKDRKAIGLDDIRCLKSDELLSISLSSPELDGQPPLFQSVSPCLAIAISLALSSASFFFKVLPF